MDLDKMDTCSVTPSSSSSLYCGWYNKPNAVIPKGFYEGGQQGSSPAITSAITLKRRTAALINIIISTMDKITTCNERGNFAVFGSSMLFPGVGSPASNSKVSDWLVDIEEHLEAKGVFLYEAENKKRGKNVSEYWINSAFGQ